MREMVEKLRTLQKIEDRSEKEYKKLLGNLNRPKYSDLRNLIIRLLVDTILHKRLIEAVLKAYEEAINIVRDYGGEEPKVAIIPGVPSLVMPMDFGRMGDRIPPEELIEEFLKSFPEVIVIPETSKFLEVLGKHLKSEEEMLDLYSHLSKRAFHPVVKGLISGILRNEEQHVAIIKELAKKYTKGESNEKGS